MRTVAIACSWLAATWLHGQGDLLINELQPANHGTVATAQGHHPDWIELYNAGDRPMDLKGMRLALGTGQHHFEASLVVPPRGHQLLWCDARPGRGVDHVGFKLPRSGGTVLLIAADGVTIVDLFTWPAMEGGLSMGRLPDGARSWSYFTEPTPGAPNQVAMAIRERCGAVLADPQPGHVPGPFTLTLSCEAGSEVYYTLDGTPPDPAVAKRYTGPLSVEGNTVLRARAMAPDKLPGPELHALYGVGGAPRHALSLSLAPEDLWDPERGINTPGLHNNHTRSGRAWERSGMLSVGHGGEGLGVGVRVAGSGSRGLAKRNFKLYARSSHGSPPQGLPFAEGAHFNGALLRADASPHGFLRNRLMEVVVQRNGLALEVQPSTPYTLYLNGAYWGLYRWMPPKDAAWLRHVSGAEAVDLLEGPAGVVRSGSDAHYRKALEALLGKASMAEIDVLIDTRSLIDLACMDLYMGRADHDLNVRCYRPRQAGGRWRWVLFDMDLWAPAAENSVERMCSASLPETPFMPHLVQHPELQLALLARMTALQAAVFEPELLVALGDSLYAAHEAELLADHRRWELEMDTPAPSRSHSELKDFIQQRPAHLMAHLASYSGRKLRTITIDVPPAHEGRVLLEGLPLPPGRRQLRCFSGVPLRLEAIPAADHEFVEWKGADGDTAELTVDPARLRVLRPGFRSTRTS
jgi:hypothetical protein